MKFAILLLIILLYYFIVFFIIIIRFIISKTLSKLALSNSRAQALLFCNYTKEVLCVIN